MLARSTSSSGWHHFRWRFFESRSDPAKDPLILWLNGGPGCSSLTGLFMELGPCSVSEGGKDTPYNVNSWNSNANIIFLDQPTTVGFSYSDSTEDDVSNTADAAEDVYGFLQLFLKSHPKFANTEFHVAGESYAGHYIPAIASAILTGNADAGAPDNEEDLQVINLTSIAIGNGLTDPAVQYKYYPEYACGNPYGPVLEQAECDAMATKYGTCKSLIEGCYRYQSAFTCVPGAIYCNNGMISPFQKTGLNIYDIREKCDPSNPLCYSILQDIESYLNRADVQQELGVDVEYKGCNMEVNQRFMFAGDWMRPYVNLVPGIIDEGVHVLVYAGDADFICNYMGNRAWTLELEWSGKDGFNAAPELDWVSKATGKKAGLFRTFDKLTYLTVYEAGHMVPL
ncbi:Alpha/Beta hydrolase protein [Obelidium mucronatum]|nr:Alpha/Beta hydrolase protein [Obelidium mucronatum]